MFLFPDSDRILEPSIVHIVNVLLNKLGIYDNGFYVNNIYSIIKCALEYTMLKRCDASFAEYLYGIIQHTNIPGYSHQNKYEICMMKLSQV